MDSATQHIKPGGVVAYGQAVYKARSLYILDYHEVDFDDYAICNSTVSFKTDERNAIEEQKATNQFLIVPNPTTDRCRVLFYKTDIDEIEVTDVSGHVCMSKKVERGVYTVELDTRLLNNGYYQISLKNSKVLVKSLKWSVVK